MVPTAAKVDEASALFFRNQLREARAQALRDAEDFHDLLFTFERLGAYLRGGTGKGLDAYTKAILHLVAPNVDGAGTPQTNLEPQHLLDLVRIARNDALHQGASARHLTTNAIRVALILEDALMAQVIPQRVRHFMVASPTCAELWQPLGVVRHSMLANSFSYLPIKDAEGNWKLLSDYSVVQFIRIGDRRTRLDMSVGEALKQGLTLDPTVTVDVDQEVPDVLVKPFNGRPFLVLEAEGARLAGILTAFDLL
ncbi:hypothetical protein [Hyalangium sp.]|uniref:hypothetical protein n=1 Tax=Hyalangium sp. TaxID=2028555 RepID=UPI002D4FBC31|nr:hypothetical protein [Hyalangium sp.]HYH96502.1 hypothetical protein [Hyalangium sp.]